MECVPTVRVAVVKVALVTPALVLSEPWPMLVRLSKKDAVPVGVPEPFGRIVAVKITVWPETDGPIDETTDVVVLIPPPVTVSEPESVPLLKAKVLSPL